MTFIKGQKKIGGRKKKIKNKKTIKREKQQQLYETYLLANILKEKGGIIKALLKESKLGNVRAIKEVHERLLGKVIEEVKHSGDINIPLTSIIINPIKNDKQKEDNKDTGS